MFDTNNSFFIKTHFADVKNILKLWRHFLVCPDQSWCNQTVVITNCPLIDEMKVIMHNVYWCRNCRFIMLNEVYRKVLTSSKSLLYFGLFDSHRSESSPSEESQAFCYFEHYSRQILVEALKNVLDRSVKRYFDYTLELYSRLIEVYRNVNTFSLRSIMVI